MSQAAVDAANKGDVRAFAAAMEKDQKKDENNEERGFNYSFRFRHKLSSHNIDWKNNQDLFVSKLYNGTCSLSNVFFESKVVK